MLISDELGVYILMVVWLLCFVKCKLKFKLKLGILLNLIIYVNVNCLILYLMIIVY